MSFDTPSDSPNPLANAHADDQARTDSASSSHQRRLKRLDEMEKVCLNDPDTDARCLGPPVAGLKKIVAHYEQALLTACADSTVVLKLRSEFQTYVSLLRTVERFENLELRRAELQKKQQRGPLKLRHTNGHQFRL